MFKKRLAVVVVPVLAAAAVIGSGFSAWYFGAEDKYDTANGTIGVTEIVSKIGAIEATPKTFTLELDQGGIANKDDRTKGISIKGTTTNTEGATVETDTITATWTGAKTDIEPLLATGVELQFTVTVTVDSALATYVELVGATTTTKDDTTNKVTYTYSYGNVDKVGDLTVDGDNYKKVIEFGTTYTVKDEENNTETETSRFNYVANKKPSDATAHETMNTAVNNRQLITVTFTVEAIEPTPVSGS